jgi:integrase
VQGRIFRFEELVQIWRESETESRTIAVLFKLMVLTGQRLSDLLEMRWDLIDGDMCKVSRVLSPLKTKSHTVFLAQPAIDMLRELFSQHGSSPVFVAPSPFVFPGRRAERVSYIRHASRRISIRASISPPISARDIRRSVRAHLALGGARPEVISRMLDRQPEDLKKFGYDSELKETSRVWAKRIIDAVTPNVTPPPPLKGKVVSLFGGGRRVS